MNKMRFLIISNGPGETSQGVAFAKYIKKLGHSADLNVIKKNIAKIISFHENKVTFYDDPGTISPLINKKFYDVVVFCNSTLFRKYPLFQKVPPTNKPIAVSIDSNWLFGDNDEFPHISWLDEIYINIPKKVFQYGLKENSGKYQISDQFKTKIKEVGLIPSYESLSPKEKKEIREKLGVQSDEKLIFSYIGSDTTLHTNLYDKLDSLFKKLYEVNKGKIKIYFASPIKDDKPWLIKKTNDIVDSDFFFSVLASSDLLIQHQGLGTLEQAISAQIPTIANVVMPNVDEKITAHAWEVEPFQRAGLCRMHYFSDDVDEIYTAAVELLSDEGGQRMRSCQEKFKNNGEELAFNSILRLFESIPEHAIEKTYGL